MCAEQARSWYIETNGKGKEEQMFWYFFPAGFCGRVHYVCVQIISAQRIDDRKFILEAKQNNYGT